MILGFFIYIYMLVSFMTFFYLTWKFKFGNSSDDEYLKVLFECTLLLYFRVWSHNRVSLSKPFLLLSKAILLEDISLLLLVKCLYNLNDSWTWQCIFFFNFTVIYSVKFNSRCMNTCLLLRRKRFLFYLFWYIYYKYNNNITTCIVFMYTLFLMSNEWEHTNVNSFKKKNLAMR